MVNLPGTQANPLDHFTRNWTPKFTSRISIQQVASRFFALHSASLQPSFCSPISRSPPCVSAHRFAMFNLRSPPPYLLQSSLSRLSHGKNSILLLTRLLTTIAILPPSICSHTTTFPSQAGSPHANSVCHLNGSSCNDKHDITKSPSCAKVNCMKIYACPFSGPCQISVLAGNNSGMCNKLHPILYLKIPV